MTAVVSHKTVNGANAIADFRTHGQVTTHHVQ